MKEFELKPCPFCGGRTEVYVRFGNVFIGCYKCHAHIHFTDCETEIAQTVTKYETRAESNSGWISVNEKLPDKEGSYLVSLHQEDDEMGESADCVLFAWYRPVNLLYCEKNIGWILLNEFYDLTEKLKGYITHWQPLPEPPTKEKDDE